MAMSETGPEAFKRRIFEQGFPEHGFEYLRPLRPRRFPVEAEVPESLPHLELRTALYQLLSFFLRGQATVGSDQFVYYDASNPKACVAPDVYLKLGSEHTDIGSWKTWELGTPELAVEIASRSDAPEEPWENKLVRYHRLGVRELVRFDPRAPEQLRVWDYVEGDLAERRVSPNSAVPCRVLGVWWVVVVHERRGPMLRLSRDAQGQDLIKNELEVEAEARQAAEALQRQAEARQVEAEALRRQAEARVRELEAELRRLRSGKAPE
jgi:hypothetical protein